MCFNIMMNVLMGVFVVRGKQEAFGLDGTVSWNAGDRVLGDGDHL